jgi:hypothetical protein
MEMVLVGQQTIILSPTRQGNVDMGANDINKGKFAHVKVVEMLRGPKKIHIVRRCEWS